MARALGAARSKVRVCCRVGKANGSREGAPVGVPTIDFNGGHGARAPLPTLIRINACRHCERSKAIHPFLAAWLLRKSEQ
jgi:hypothetical protein